MVVDLSAAEIRARLRDFVREAFLLGDDVNLEDDTSLLESGILDSTGVLELVLHLEQEYQLQVADEEILPDNLDSIERLCRFVQSKLPT